MFEDPPPLPRIVDRPPFRILDPPPRAGFAREENGNYLEAHVLYRNRPPPPRAGFACEESLDTLPEIVK